MAASTYSDWVRERECGTLGTKTLGRPRQREVRIVRAAVKDVLDNTKSVVSIAFLKRRFPDVSRSRLMTMRTAHRRAHRGHCIRLQWTQPGTVWAADYTELKKTPDGERGWVLVVRDLASGMILGTAKTAHATAERSCAVFARLFNEYGPPLVLKTDNGSHFTADIVTDLLADRGVTHLRSPPYFPRYNGAIEAGMHVLKPRLYAVADDPDFPTIDDLERARAICNEWIDDHLRTSAEERWRAGSRSIPPEERAAFLAAAAAARDQLLAELDAASLALLETDSTARATVARRAIERALVERDYLKIRRSRKANMSTQQVAVLSES